MITLPARPAITLATQPPITLPARPAITLPIPPHSRRFRPEIHAHPFMPGYASAYSTMPGLYGSYPMLYGGYSSYPMSGGYGSYAMPYGSYGSYPTSGTGGYGSTSSSTPAQANQSSRVPTSDDIEVSGPLDTPPPHRGIIRIRLPRTWVDVSIDGRKIDSVGKMRTYVTPELPRERTFEVVATWKDNGRTSRIQDQVTVQAGQIRTLDFTSGK
jgi:uncharacterized protein (TIGR03000 family)